MGMGKIQGECEWERDNGNWNGKDMRELKLERGKGNGNGKETMGMRKRQGEWERDKRNKKRGMGKTQGEWERDKGKGNVKETRGMGMGKIQEE